MEFVSPIIGPIVQSLMVPIKKHLGFLVSSTKYVKKMDARKKQLEDLAKDVQSKRKKAIERTEEVPERVEPWLEDVKHLMERSNLIETTRCLNMTKRYKVGKQSYGILEEIQDLQNQQSGIVFTPTEICLADVGSTSTGPSTSTPVPMSNRNNFKSRNSIFNNALQALQSNKVSQNMIALCGMGGVGKTTMMEQLKKVVEDSGTFDWVVKVVIGENTDSIALQEAIAQYIGKNLTETTKDARADRLHKIFKAKSQGQKKTLVIMDDLWKAVDLTDVGLSPLPNGFKLLITSRFENVCTQMYVITDSIFTVRVLNDSEAQTLFSGIVGQSPSNGDDADLQRIGEDIVKKCGGLPIAIVTIAKTLRGNIKQAWKEALSNLQRNDLQDLDGIVHKVFEMSYNNLTKEDDKAIFLLAGLFPDDFNIPIEDLMMYGWGLKLFTNVNTLIEARSRIIICVNNLICANLLTKSDRMGCVKMHDLVRAFVLSNFSKVKQASIVNHDNISLERLTKDSYERVLLKCTGMSGFPTDFSYQNLSLLILMDGYDFFKFPEDIHKRMKQLEVLSYENMGTPVLPIAFEHSTTLRTLCLRSCSLTADISFLGSLCNLETLSLADCNIRKLPLAIGKLKKLKLLDLTGCVDLYIDQGVLQNLNSLEELYMRASKGTPVRFTDANCEELEKLSHGLSAFELEFFDNKLQPKNMSFQKLESFRISIGCELKSYEKYSFINTLNLVVECNELKECDIRDLFKKTEELRLEVKYMIHLEDVSLHHTFSQLRFLHISKCAELTYLFTVDTANGLTILERLTISECRDLKALIGENSGVGVVTLKKLTFMSLEGLPEMVSLCDNVIELPEMVALRLDGLPKFKSIYPDSNNNTSEMRPLFNKKVVIPKLEKLDISMMVNLMQIWPCQIATNEVSTLRHITVRKCDSLINLFPSNPLPLLNDLEEVVVTYCGSVEVLFNIDFASGRLMGKHGSRLRRIEVAVLGKLKELWRMRGINNSGIHINSFKGVKYISIELCERFTNIFTPTTTDFDLGALTTYVSKRNGGDLEEMGRKTKMIESDQEINVTYPSYLLHTCPHLQHLHLWVDRRVKEVMFDMDSPISKQSPLLLPYLETIYLNDLEMSHVWKCNWNKLLVPQHQPSQFPFQNLTQITLGFCHKIKYLFSPVMAKYLSNLKSVTLEMCDGIEEVVSSRDDENTTSTSSHQNFPCLDTLYVESMMNLKRIDGEENTWSRRDKISSNINDHLQSVQVIDAYWSLCQYPRKITIRNCWKLSSLIPWYAAGKMKRLEVLEIDNCETMMDVFGNELRYINTNNVDEGSAQSGAGTSPTLENITTVVVPQLSNLKTVCIYDCDLLPHIFTFSTLKILKHLKELKVKRCKKMCMIVKEENETSSEVVFSCLETLELDNLPNLNGFFLGKNGFFLPSLVNVMINDCPQWAVFTSGELKTPKIRYAHTNLGKYSLECGFNFQTTFPTSSDPTISEGMPSSFHNLIEINIEKTYVATTIIPSHGLLQLQKLEKITINECKGVEEVFGVVALEGMNKSLSVVKIPNLTQVNLMFVRDLKYLWKSNQWMVLEFPNLTTVSLDNCDRMEHVFTCAMVGSLVQLQDLHISDCWSIEVIVKEEEEECDAKVNEIMLPRLKSLQLNCLRRLKGFCLGKKAFSLPALDTLEIKECWEITVFTRGHLSSPKLKEIKTPFGMCDVRTDLNSFIETKQEEDSFYYGPGSFYYTTTKTTLTGVNFYTLMLAWFYLTLAATVK